MKKALNLFLIPSWYPSPQHPLTGIFFKEQAEIFAEHHPDIHIGISHWGQNDERLLLWSKHPFGSIKKILTRRTIEPQQQQPRANLTEYFTPSFTWSGKFRRGNIRNIIQANVDNFRKFQNDAGKVNLIHAHVGYPAGFIARELSKRFKIPYVITEHMSPFPFSLFVAKNNEWMDDLSASYRDANALIAVSSSMKSTFIAQGFTHVITVPNFIDDHFFIPRPKPSTPSLRILTIGRMVPQKGIDVLLKAIERLKDKRLTVEFMVGGGGENLEEYQQMASASNLRNILWTGELSRDLVAQSFAESDIFLLPSRHESFGVAVLEALACGKPCIVTRCGGPEEIVTDDVGIVVEKENPEALAAAIVSMIHNINRYQPEKIRTYYEKHFSSRIATRALRTLYQKVTQEYQ